MTYRRTPIFTAVLFFFMTAASMAQVSLVTPEIGLRLREMGKGLSPEIMSTTTRLYVPLHANAPREGGKVTRDEKYGPDERQRLDVYAPVNKPDGPVPILMFVHGGAFVAGDKSTAGSPFYDNIGYYFARHGVLTIVPTYRLAPKHKWPAGTEDVAGALAWVRKNGEQFGGDTNRVFLMGHSAGGAHVASYVFQKEFQLKEGDGLVGAILMSGLYDPAKAPSPAYYGEDASKYPSMAPIRFIEGRKNPRVHHLCRVRPPLLRRSDIRPVSSPMPTGQGLPGNKAGDGAQPSVRGVSHKHK